MVRLLIHVEPFVEKAMAAEHVTVVCRKNDDSVFRQALLFKTVENAPDLGINERAESPIAGDDFLPIGPGEVAGVPAEHLLLLDRRFVNKLFVKVAPAFNVVRFIHRIIRGRHGVWKMRSKEIRGDHKGLRGVRISID